MDSQKYLESYGWTPGEALQKGGLKKPILVSHKFDLKGIGHGAKESVSWWETIFDGQLKSLDVNNKGEFSKDKEKQKQIEREEIKKNSPLYQMFVKGEVLMGTVDKDGKRNTKHTKNSHTSNSDGSNGSKKRNAETMETGNDGEQEQLVFFYSSDEDDEDADKKEKKEKKKRRKEKKEKKAAKKERRAAKKEKRDKKAAKKALKKAST